jgi:uncharacterized integral membrane protein
MQLLTIVAMLFVVLAVLFALQNNIPVVVSFLAWNFEGSLALVLLIALALGGLIVALASTPSTLRRQLMIARLKRRVDEMERASRKRAEDEKSDASPQALPESGYGGSVEEVPYVGLKEIVTGKGESREG